MDKYCAKCGFPLSEGQRFCPGCGIALLGAAPGSAMPESAPEADDRAEMPETVCEEVSETPALSAPEIPEDDGSSPAHTHYAAPAAPPELTKTKHGSRKKAVWIVLAAALTVLALAIGLTLYFYSHRLSREEQVILGQWSAAGAVMDGEFYSLEDRQVLLTVEKDHTASLQIADRNRLSWEYLRTVNGELYYTVSPGSGLCYLPDSDELILIVSNDYVIFLER